MARGNAAQAQSRSAEALRDALRAVSPDVLAISRSVLGSGADAEDAAQESLIAIARAFESFRGDGSWRGFCRRIAVRTAMRLAKRRRARIDAGELVEEVAASSADGDPLQARRRAFLRGLLQTIPEEQSQALVMRYMLGYSLQETAEAMEVPVNTVRSRVRLGREALSRTLQQRQALREELELSDG